MLGIAKQPLNEKARGTIYENSYSFVGVASGYAGCFRRYGEPESHCRRGRTWNSASRWSVSSTLQGSLAICLNPSTFAEESCTTSGVLVAPLSVLQNGAVTWDEQGNCALPSRG